MSKRIMLVLALLAALPVMAQQAPPTVAAAVKGYYMGNQRNIVGSANKMPEEFYGLRPGPQMEVRTFGQHLLHVATYNYIWCSQAKGEKNPNAGKNLEKEQATAPKADIVKTLTDSFAYCDGAFNALTDASGAEIVQITQESGQVQMRPRMALLMLVVAHNNELYGNIVTTLRIKSIVPPSSEPRPAAPGR